ncbi:BTAD domain-containing putative transcriptional regulator [Spongiactinospora gelatinilytica]|uniref:BTAD domain-containing putative transcriptional regulator n=1 Tax=Spongiactinospora gelatinilytica TaxID=2666298 RepID=UPI0011B946BC|nr:BTAD domain-containing putative transcriptional regulator [Spongiactinospora gelatinilytica]
MNLDIPSGNLEITPEPDPYTLTLPPGGPGLTWQLPEECDPATALPCVVLADRAGLTEFAALQRGLRTLGVPSLRIDAEAIDDLRIAADIADRSLTVNGRRIVPTVTWVRHFSPRAIPNSANSPFRADSWCALVAQMSRLAAHHLPGGPDIGRLIQLDDAARAGIRTPRTIVTTDPAAASDSLPGDRVIVKALDGHFVETEPGTLAGVFPEIMDTAAARGLSVRDAPMIVQEYVDHGVELRVYFLEGEIRTFRVSKPSPEALWCDADSVSVCRVTTPQSVVGAVRRLADLWGLRYGAFDFLMTRHGPVFLEVNSDGDWRWFESKAGVDDVSMAVLAMVRTLHSQAAPKPAAPIDLTGFLTLGTGRCAPAEQVRPAMDASVLGTFEIRMDGSLVRISARKTRLLAAILLLSPNQVVATDQLIDSLWGETPPPTARKNLQVHVSELRRKTGDRISYEGWGYRLDATPDELDLLRFRHLAGAGRDLRRRGDGEAALNLLDDATRLWRGRPLVEFSGVPLVDEAVSRCTELYLTVSEDWAELKIERGGHVEVLTRLDDLVSYFPTRERLIAARMTALVGCGRAPEALSQFESLRRHLAAELGIDPSPALRKIYEAILQGRLEDPWSYVCQELDT